MIDNFALAVSHGLLALAFWRLMNNPAVDHEGPEDVPSLGHRKGQTKPEAPADA